MHGLHVFCLCFLWFVIILGELTNVVCEQLINPNTELGDILSERSQSKISTSSVEHDPQPEKDLLNTDADCDLRENKNSPEAHITAHKSKLSFAPCLCKMHGISIDLKQISRESFFWERKKRYIYHWHKVKHIVLPMTKSNGLPQNAFNISLPYIFWVENGNFGILKHLYWLKWTRFLGQNSLFEKCHFWCWVQIKDRKGLSFSHLLDQCSLKIVTAKFDMSDDLVRSILKANMSNFLSWNVQ